MSRDLGGTSGPPSGMDPAVSQMDRLGARLVRLEEALDQLIETHRNLMSVLAERANSRKRKDMPSPNTKYYEFLIYLSDNFGQAEFTSDEIPRQSRHILSILNTEYSSLDVVSKRGRTNVYRISPEVLKRLKKGS